MSLDILEKASGHPIANLRGSLSDWYYMKLFPENLIRKVTDILKSGVAKHMSKERKQKDDILLSWDEVHRKD